MPQMANDALSEYWLLKELGDIHWILLSHGLEQKSSEFKDFVGNRLYAAFVRINYSLSPLKHFQENEILNLKGEIKRFKNNTYFSNIHGVCNESTLSANLMTSFTLRKFKDNASIVKGKINGKVNHIKQLKTIPEFLNQHRLLKKEQLSELKANKNKFKITDKAITSLSYSLNPFYEINGVGLLYFACYPIISDKCSADFFKTSNTVKDYEFLYHTIYRDIFYYANCNATDNVIFKLNSVEKIGSNKLKLTSSLYRQSDNVLMAKLFTVKQKAK